MAATYSVSLRDGSTEAGPWTETARSAGEIAERTASGQSMSARPVSVTRVVERTSTGPAPALQYLYRTGRGTFIYVVIRLIGGDDGRDWANDPTTFIPNNPNA